MKNDLITTQTRCSTKQPCWTCSEPWSVTSMPCPTLHYLCPHHTCFFFRQCYSIIDLLWTNSLFTLFPISKNLRIFKAFGKMNIKNFKLWHTAYKNEFPNDIRRVKTFDICIAFDALPLTIDFPGDRGETITINIPCPTGKGVWEGIFQSAGRVNNSWLILELKWTEHSTFFIWKVKINEQVNKADRTYGVIVPLWRTISISCHLCPISYKSEKGKQTWAHRLSKTNSRGAVQSMEMRASKV